MSKISGVVLTAGTTTAVKGTPTARISLSAGKNKDGSYKEGVIVSLVGKNLAKLAAKDKVEIFVGHLADNTFTRKSGEKGVELSGVASKVRVLEAGEKVNAFEVFGNLAADPKDGKFDIISNGENEGEKASYSVRVAKGGVDGLKKGDFVKVGGIVEVNIGTKKVFRDVTAFAVEKIEKKAKA
jgi:hypothetical protein